MIPDGDSRAYSYSSVEPHSSRPMPELRFSITQQQNSFLRLLSTKLGCFGHYAISLSRHQLLLYLKKCTTTKGKFIFFRWPTRSHSPLQPMGGATLMPTWIPLATEMLYMEATQQKHSLHAQYATLIYILLQTRVIPSGFDAWAKQASSSYSVDFSLYFPKNMTLEALCK